jgi:hypothetical protein
MKTKKDFVAAEPKRCDQLKPRMRSKEVKWSTRV